jgi:hypothetical protein
MTASGGPPLRARPKGGDTVSAAAPAIDEPGREEKGRRAIRGAFLGFFVDMFDTCSHRL